MSGDQDLVIDEGYVEENHRIMEEAIAEVRARLAAEKGSSAPETAIAGPAERGTAKREKAAA